MTGIKRIAVAFLSAQMVVLLLFAPYIARILSRPVTRYHFMWQTRDAVYLVACMMSLALGCVALAEVVRRFGGPLLKRVFGHLFVIGLGGGFLANVSAIGSEYASAASVFSIEGAVIRLGWLVLFATVVWSFFRGRGMLVLRCRQLCQIMSPMIILIVIQLFAQNTYPESLDSLELSEDRAVPSRLTGSARPHPVYLLVFDEWSYRRSFENREPRSELQNLRALASQSFLFHDAHSPDEWTHGSMPKLLFQTDMPVEWGGGRVGFVPDNKFVSAQEQDSLFLSPAIADHQSYLLGFHLPYESWLGDQVDAYRVYRWYERGDSPATRFGVQLYEATRFWTDPLTVSLHDRFKFRVEGRHVLRLRQQLRRDLLTVIAQGRHDTVTVFHYPLPHSPFLFKHDGDYCGNEESAWDMGNVQGYGENLIQMDHLVGEFVTAMKNAGVFDEAILILTSDHNWRYDPQRKADPKGKDALSHVPLIVKLPRQADGVSVNAPFENRTLGNMLECVLKAETSEKALAAVARLVGVRNVASRRREEAEKAVFRTETGRGRG